jgi:hypothetical protein
MYPNCETVEYARTRLRFMLFNAIVAAMKAVTPPMTATKSITSAFCMNSG